jgi:hypothetical protein
MSTPNTRKTARKRRRIRNKRKRHLKPLKRDWKIRKD